MIKIFEPIYKPNQVLEEPEFTVYHHTSNEKFRDWRELRIHIEIYRKSIHKKQDYTGVFSPKFRLKTKLSGFEFISFVKNNPGYDLYFVNPFPQMKYLSYNIWMQAEANHPGIVEAAQNLLNAAGIDINLNLQPRHDATTLAYSNFWIGNTRFWEEFVGGVLHPLATHIESNPNNPEVQRVFANTFHTDPAPYLPFITERMFTTFLSINPQVKKINLNLPPLEYCLTPEERKYVERMIPAIDQADATGSFPPELKDTMEKYCKTAAAAAQKFFEVNPHPHSGRTITESKQQSG